VEARCATEQTEDLNMMGETVHKVSRSLLSTQDTHERPAESSFKLGVRPYTSFQVAVQMPETYNPA